MSTVEHAKREFLALGYIPLEKEQEDGPNKWIQENILELLDVFSKQGHSGASANFCLDTFNKLANHKPLCPLTLHDNEWTNVHGDTYQNKRDSRVFKDGKDGRAHFIEAYIEKTQTGGCWQGSLSFKDGTRVRRCFIKNTKNMPTIYLDVIETEVEKDNWEMYLKDMSQLEELREHYDLEIV